MTPTQRKGLQELFEGSFERDLALDLLGLTQDQDAHRTWTRWQAELDEFGHYISEDPGSPKGLLGAVFTGISDMIWDDDAWRELNDIVDAASPFREIWG